MRGGIGSDVDRDRAPFMDSVDAVRMRFKFPTTLAPSSPSHACRSANDAARARASASAFACISSATGQPASLDTAVPALVAGPTGVSSSSTTRAMGRATPAAGGSGIKRSGLPPVAVVQRSICMPTRSGDTTDDAAELCCLLGMTAAPRRGCGNGDCRRATYSARDDSRAPVPPTAGLALCRRPNESLSEEPLEVVRRGRSDWERARAVCDASDSSSPDSPGSSSGSNPRRTRRRLGLPPVERRAPCAVRSRVRRVPSLRGLVPDNDRRADGDSMPGGEGTDGEHRRRWTCFAWSWTSAVGEMVRASSPLLECGTGTQNCNRRSTSQAQAVPGAWRQACTMSGDP